MTRVPCFFGVCCSMLSSRETLEIKGTAVAVTLTGDSNGYINALFRVGFKALGPAMYLDAGCVSLLREACQNLPDLIDWFTRNGGEGEIPTQIKQALETLLPQVNPSTPGARI